MSSRLVIVSLIVVVAITALVIINLPKCSKEGEICTQTRKCCDNLSCIEGKCKTTGGDESQCAVVGQNCTTKSCCSGLYCDVETKTCLEDTCKSVFNPTVTFQEDPNMKDLWGHTPLGFIGDKSINLLDGTDNSIKLSSINCDRPNVSDVEGGWQGPLTSGKGCAMGKYCPTLTVSDESKDTCRFSDSKTLTFMDRTDTANCKISFNYTIVQ